MPTGIALHFGVNRPAGDCCNLDTLKHAENAARQMGGIALAQGFQIVQVYTESAATATAVIESVRLAAARLHRGDMLFLSFSGHGCRVPDRPPRDEIDKLDETWCMAEQMLRDDELIELWRSFREGVRILIIAESCHSEGSIFLPVELPLGRTARDAPAATASTHAGASSARIECPPDPPTDDGIKASVLLLAATQERLTGLDGLFTRSLMRVWNRGGFNGDYCRLMSEIEGLMMGEPTPQEPRMLMKGTPRPSFPRERAFTI